LKEEDSIYASKVYKGKNLIINIESIADFISGHESLLNTGILYRDVSIGNVMLTENKDNGFLIDADLGSPGYYSRSVVK